MDDPVDRVRAAYDAMPYESHAFPQTAPGHLAAIAYLFGLDVVDVSSARVLEIGCAAGGNLIPFATWHPRREWSASICRKCRSTKGAGAYKALGLKECGVAARRRRRYGPGGAGAVRFHHLPRRVQLGAGERAGGDPVRLATRSWLPRVWPTSARTCIRGGRPRRSCATPCCCAVARERLRRRSWATRAG